MGLVACGSPIPIFPNAVPSKSHDQLQASNSFKILFALENLAGFHEFLDIWYDLVGRNFSSCKAKAGCISNAICLDENLGGLVLVVLQNWQLGNNHKATQMLDEWECTKSVPFLHVFTRISQVHYLHYLKKGFAHSYAFSVGLPFIFLWAML